MSIDEYYNLIKILPLESIEYAFAYGSGAIEQANEDKQSKMVDFILVTRDPLEFHHKNITINREHYSFLRYAGHKVITNLQCNYAARIYYNTLIKSNGRMIKYGVISYEDLLTDLQDWSWLYVAGRLQKPVLEVIKSQDEPLKSALRINRKSALQAALLQLPDKFSFEKLFQEIVQLSYSGDIRMKFGEDQNKIKKIVKGSMGKFMDTYHPLLADDSRIRLDGPKIEQDNSTPAIYHRLNLLPYSVLDRLAQQYRIHDPKQRDIEEVLFSLAHRHDVPVQVAYSIRSIVSNSSGSQTYKNALTAGILKSIIYALQKVKKRISIR